MNINLEHTVEEVNTIIKALEELPHRLVHALLVKIHSQAIPQTHTPPVDVAAPAAPVDVATVAPVEPDTHNG
jgi:hypothetical protein